MLMIDYCLCLRENSNVGIDDAIDPTRSRLGPVPASVAQKLNMSRGTPYKDLGRPSPPALLKECSASVQGATSH